MPHMLSVGMTESGKTTLNKDLSQAYRTRGIETIVLDPLLDERWAASFITNDPDKFLQVFWSSESCAIFVDEGGDTVGKYDIAMQRIVTSGRHLGHNVHIISQRGAQLSKTVRDQCRYLALFCSSKDDCKLYSREFNKDELLLGNQLPQGEFYFCGRFSGLSRGNVFL
jgi:hypothetical protein